MLEKIDTLSLDVANLIIYTNSAILQTFLKKKIKEKFNIGRNHTKYADTGSELKVIKNETFTPPFDGGIWVVDVDTSKISISEIGKALNMVSTSAINVYWVTQYSQYKKICDLDVVKKQGIYCYQMYTGRLYPEDITYLHQQIVPDEYKLPKPLLDFLKKNYTYNVEDICRVLDAVSHGEKIKSTKDIIDMVGIGGNTVDSFVMKLLTSNPKTEKGCAKSFEKIVILLDDLAYKYSFSQIKNYMNVTIRAILEIKQLQMMGKYSMSLKVIPDSGFNSDKIEKLKRYDRSILDEINISRVLLLKFSFDKYNNFDYEIALLQGISEYLSAICRNNMNNPESKEKFANRRGHKV